ncbi:hypothetical protein YTPLAS21_02550 [Candidatus Nitrosocosmicus sp.]|nr:hypothetical protein YTPLAS21_02550 [Candidatus Nitrosocosmicus sp.]
MSDSKFYSGDWLKIKIKFSGVCLNCKQKINTGDVGYWSRNTKSIVHTNCYLGSKQIEQDTNPVGNRGNVGMNKGAMIDAVATTSTRQKNELCFICNNPVDLNDPLIIELIKIVDGGNQLKSLYCALCLKGFNTRIFEDYKTSFNRRIKK